MSAAIVCGIVFGVIILCLVVAFVVPLVLRMVYSDRTDYGTRISYGPIGRSLSPASNSSNKDQHEEGLPPPVTHTPRGPMAQTHGTSTPWTIAETPVVGTAVAFDFGRGNSPRYAPVELDDTPYVPLPGTAITK